MPFNGSDRRRELGHFVLRQQADLQAEVGTVVRCGRHSVLADQHGCRRKMASTDAIIARTTGLVSFGNARDPTEICDDSETERRLQKAARSR
jgi:hypothetical protein